jgi:hypothetical protein
MSEEQVHDVARAAAARAAAALPVPRFLPATVESYDGSVAVAVVRLDGDPVGAGVAADVVAYGFVPVTGQRVMCVWQPPSSLLVIGVIGV